MTIDREYREKKKYSNFDQFNDPNSDTHNAGQELIECAEVEGCRIQRRVSTKKAKTRHSHKNEGKYRAGFIRPQTNLSSH